MDRLLQSHAPYTYQSFKRLSAVPILSGQLLSALLATMLDFFPRGEESASFLPGLSCRLLRQLRLLLTHEVLSDLKFLVAKADKLHAAVT
jgi:hypothetical protein